MFSNEDFEILATDSGHLVEAKCCKLVAIDGYSTARANNNNGFIKIFGALLDGIPCTLPIL